MSTIRMKSNVDKETGIVTEEVDYEGEPIGDIHLIRPLLEVKGAISASEYMGLPTYSFTGGNITGDIYLTGSLYVNGVISGSQIVGPITTGSDSGVAGYGATRILHEPCVYAGGNTSSPGQIPQPLAFGPMITSVYTLNDTNDRGYRIIKIPTSYVSSASFHVHWTKSGNSNESGRAVRWRVVYTVFDGKSINPLAVTQSIEFEQPYLDNGTTDRYVYRTHDIPTIGFVPNYYCSMYIEAISPTGSALIDKPALVGLDLLYRATINQGN